MKKNLYLIFPLVLICLFNGDVAAKINTRYHSETPRSLSVAKPAANATDVDAPVLKVTANIVSGATRYTIELNTSPTFSNPSMVQASALDNQRTLTFAGLAYAQTYYARVKTDLSDEFGRVTRFTTHAEEFPTIMEVVATADASPHLIKLLVSPVSQARRYTLEVNEKPNFAGQSRLFSGADGETEFIVNDLSPATTYFGRAITDISTAYGPVISFRTRAQAKQKRLWGLTTAGGTYASGTVFSFSLDSSTFTKHNDYQETNDYPNAYLKGSLIPAPDGGFFGNSECEKNGTCANGEVFYISPQGKFELRYTLGIHAGSVMLASNNRLYIVDDWINLFRGGIWKLNADSTGSYPIEDIIYRFGKRSLGRNPRNSLLELPDGFLYGLAPYGGDHNAGTIFRLNRKGKEFQVLYQFDGANSGANPDGSLILGADGYLYGTTALGGSSDKGVLFKIQPDGNGYKKIFDFQGLNGENPMGNLLEGGDFLYGTTSEGGSADKGVLFSIRTDGTAYRKLLDFNGENGANPFGTPVIDGKQTLFAMTSAGGEHDMGVIFKININGSGFAKLFEFSEETGGGPDGDLLLRDDTFRKKTIAEPLLATIADKVGLFPNPFVNTLIARLDAEGQQTVKFILSDLRGNILQERTGETNSNVELGKEVGRGIYILKVVKGAEVSLHRIVKK